MDNFGWLSLIPPLVAIVLAIVTREVIVSLFIGVVSGVLIFTGGSVTGTFVEVFELIVGKMADGEWNARILLTVALMGAMVGLLTKSGASMAFARYAQQRVKSRRGTQLITVAAGIFVFFDDYFNSLAIGAVMQPVVDKFKVSREKLAYLLDSTAAPVCVLVPVSTWAAYILSLIAAEYQKIGNDTAPLQAFFSSLPYNYYAWTTLAVIAFIAYTGFDFGPMARAEREAELSTGTVEVEVTASKGTLLDIFVPVVGLIVATLLFMVALGGYFSGATITQAFENTNSATAMMYGAFTAVFIAVIWYIANKRLSLQDSMEAVVEGMKSMMISIIVLVLAWSIGGVTQMLGTGSYVSQLVSGNIPTLFIPLVAFLASCLIAFSTGTSWGTFAIMLPIAVPMAVTAGIDIPILIGAVLAGGIFGDHCSPISDTTILSSTGAGCNHIKHVQTQLPYALLAAGGASIGFVIAGAMGSAILGVITAVGLTIGATWFIGQRART